MDCIFWWIFFLLTILLAHQRLEAGQSEAVSAAVLPDQAQLEPEIVIQTGDHLTVLVLDVRGPEDAVDRPLVTTVIIEVSDWSIVVKLDPI